MVVGREDGAHFGIQEGAAPACCVLVDAPRALARGASWRLPDSFVMPVAWPLETYAEKVYADFVEVRRKMGGTERDEEGS